ncbi:MAG: hypothetical protein JWP30_1276 [Homoserinimonas sp.]|jgi:4,5-dihydroxyphthalate decarboxylase|nr:hypothetical protein [Homoserinimonas sp.]
MNKLQLRTAVADYDRVQPLVDGSVQSDKLDLNAVTLAPSEIFYRLLNDSEFDVAEMSMSSHFISCQSGWDYIAIPVFPNRRLFHLNAWTTADGPSPDALQGSNFGLTEYQVTAAVWTRGILAEDFGLDLKDVSWFVERTAELSHGGETGFVPPVGTSVERMSGDDTMIEALRRGTLDVILPSPYPGMKSRLNRTDEQDLETSDDLRPLFTDARAEAARFIQAHSFLPMNHTVVVRKSLLAENPWLAQEVFTLFEQAKEKARQRLASLRRSHLVLASVYMAEDRALFGSDPYPYGYGVNAEALQTLGRFMHDQGLVSSPVDVEAAFVPSLLGT